MEKTHGRRGKTYSRAFTISGASKLFEKDRVTLHRWISSGVLKKCDGDGIYSGKARFVWGCDVEDLLCDPKRKSGSRLVPLVHRKKPLSRFQLAKRDPERFKSSDLSAIVRECAEYLLGVRNSAKAEEFLSELEPAIDRLRRIATRRR